MLTALTPAERAAILALGDDLGAVWDAPPPPTRSASSCCAPFWTITLDAGHARDIMLMLLDVHAVLDQLHLDGTQPQITAMAEAILRESGSPTPCPRSSADSAG